MPRSRFEPMTMEDIMRRWPATVRIILRHGLLCAGCPAAAFHTVEDAIRQHEIDGAAFRRDLALAIGGDTRGNVTSRRRDLRPGPADDEVRRRSPAGGRS